MKKSAIIFYDTSLASIVPFINSWCKTHGFDDADHLYINTIPEGESIYLLKNYKCVIIWGCADTGMSKQAIKKFIFKLIKKRVRFISLHDSIDSERDNRKAIEAIIREVYRK